MARWHGYLAALLALAALDSGCAANRPGNPFGSKSSKSSAAQLAKKGKGGSAADGDESGSTGKNDLASANGLKSSATDDDDSSPGGGRGNATGSKAANGGGHDPDTMAYINDQLCDATPEERQELLADLQALHPEAVRQILQQRRRRINLQQQELAAQRNGNAVRLGPIQPASGELASETGYGNQADASQYGPPMAVGNGLPIGHNSAYRAAGQPPASAATAYAALPSNPAGAGRVDHALGQSVGNSSNVNQALANDVTAGPRTAGAKPASVSIGMPMNAGPGSATGAEHLATDRLANNWQSSSRLSKPRLSSCSSTTPRPENKRSSRKQVELRMEYLMAGQQERALQAIPGIDPAYQEFWQQEFWGLTNHFDTSSIPSSTERAAQTVTQLTNAVLRLQEKASLELRNVTFCHKISNFGNFEKYPREEFSPGQEVLLYAEVSNIHSEPIPDGKFRTSLKSTIEVCHHGPNSELIERTDLPETVDICRTHRRDYFHSYLITIPTKLTLGPHILKLTVEDQLSRRVATYTLNFTVK